VVVVVVEVVVVVVVVVEMVVQVVERALTARRALAGKSLRMVSAENETTTQG